MTSSPPLSIELCRGRWVYALWSLQLLAVASLFALLPLQVAILASVVGSLLLIRAWPRNTPRLMILRDDRTVRLDNGAWSELSQVQGFLGTLVLTLDARRALWLWPDMLTAESSCDLRRWIKLHPPVASNASSKALVP